MDEIEKSPVFRESVALVEKQVAANVVHNPSRTETLLAEKKMLSDQIRGWSLSLGRPNLFAVQSGGVRICGQEAARSGLRRLV